MSRLLLWLALPLVAGCFAPDYGNGGFACSSDGRCPDGYQCAADQRCYKNGAAPDLATGGGGGDGGGLPVAAPASVWISGGGGAGQSSSGDSIGLSIGGSDVVGGGAAVSGGSITFGIFSSSVQ